MDLWLLHLARDLRLLHLTQDLQLLHLAWDPWLLHLGMGLLLLHLALDQPSPSHVLFFQFHSVSNPCSTPGESIPLQLPLRSSQVAQRTCVPFTRTYSVHSLEDMARQMHSSLDNSRPPSYHSHINVT